MFMRERVAIFMLKSLRIRAMIIRLFGYKSIAKNSINLIQTVKTEHLLQLTNPTKGVLFMKYIFYISF